MYTKQLHFRAIIEILWIQKKEIRIQDFTDSKKFVCIYGTFGEDFIHIGAVAREFIGKPYYWFALLRQGILYKLANVHLK